MAVTWKKLAYEEDVVTKATFNAKGDILSASGDNTPLILSVGTDGQCLIAASGQASGLDWGNPDPAAHELGGAKHNEDTLANLNSKISDGDVDKTTDPRDPNSHAASHKGGGGDSIKLSEFADPDASIEVNGQQLINLVGHTVADAIARDALTPLVGKIVWQTDELAFYACTIAV